MIDAYIWIGVWVVILIICIVELGKIENRMAEDEINKMFEYLKKRKKERLAMPKYIDADELKKCSFIIAYKDERNITQYGEFVEVVRCGDCRYWDEEFEECDCPNLGRRVAVPEGFYCGWGKRRDDD